MPDKDTMHDPLDVNNMTEEDVEDFFRWRVQGLSDLEIACRLTKRKHAELDNG